MSQINLTFSSIQSSIRSVATDREALGQKVHELTCQLLTEISEAQISQLNQTAQAYTSTDSSLSEEIATAVIQDMIKIVVDAKPDFNLLQKAQKLTLTFRFDEAVSLLERIHHPSFQPSVKQLYTAIASAYQLQGDIDKAAHLESKLKKRESKAPIPDQKLVSKEKKLLNKVHEYSQTAQHRQHLLPLLSKDCSELALAFHKSGNSEKAKEYLKKAKKFSSLERRAWECLRNYLKIVEAEKEISPETVVETIDHITPWIHDLREVGPEVTMYTAFAKILCELGKKEKARSLIIKAKEYYKPSTAYMDGMLLRDIRRKLEKADALLN